MTMRRPSAAALALVLTATGSAALWALGEKHWGLIGFAL